MCILIESFIFIQEEKDEIWKTDDHLEIFSDEDSVGVSICDDYTWTDYNFGLGVLIKHCKINSSFN